jgi:hypothetical protein
MGETSLENPKGSVFCVEVADQLLKPLALEVTNIWSLHMSVAYVCHFTDMCVFMCVSPHSHVYCICSSLFYWRWHIYEVYTWLRRHTYENAHVKYQTRMGDTHVSVFCVEVADQLLKQAPCTRGDKHMKHFSSHVYITHIYVSYKRHSYICFIQTLLIYMFHTNVTHIYVSFHTNVTRIYVS